MKKISIFLIAIIAVIGFNACTSDDSVNFVAQPDPEGVNFTNTVASSYILTEATKSNVAERFVWNEVDFGTPTTVTYELQGSATEDFSDYAVIGETGSNNLEVKVSDLMKLAKDAGLDNDPTTDAPNTGMVYFRVRAYAGNDGGNALEHISSPIALSVMLPEATTEEPAKRELYMVGDATAAGWNPDNNNTPLFRDPANEDIYYFEGRFAGGADVEGFKLVEVPGQWQPQWGGTDGVLAVNPGDGTDPSAFPVDSDAYYSLSVNIADMTYTWEEVNVSNAATYSSIGIIGTATAGGWDAETTMTQSDFNPHIWYLNDLELTDGDAKFRANNAWDDSWGADTAISGQGTNDQDPNLPVTAGTYDVWFNDLSGRYIFIPVAQQ